MAKSENLHRPYVPDMPHDYRRSYSRRDFLKAGVATGLAVSCGGFAALTQYLLDTTGTSQSGLDEARKGHPTENREEANQSDSHGPSGDQEAQRSRQNVKSLNESFFNLSSSS